MSTSHPTGSDWFGHALAGGVDVDGDDVPDYLIGDPYADARDGRIWLRSGKDGSLILTQTGDAGSLLGYSVGLLPDVDGDKLGEFWAGAPRGSLTRGGRFLIWSGKTGLELRRHDSAFSGQEFGHSAVGGQDIDGDQVPDYAIASPGILNAGFVELRSGKTGALLRRLSGSGAGSFFGAALALLPDLDGDGSAELAVGAPLGGTGGQVLLYSGKSGKLLRTLSGASAGDEFGACLAAAGDLDGDKRSELLVGAPSVRQGQLRVGALYVYDGGYLRSGGSKSLFASFVGDKDGDALGRSVVGQFDVDDDDELDFAFAAVGADGPVVNAGAVFVHSSQDKALSCDLHQISLARGGVAEFSLDAGAANAGDLFLILGSLSGTSPKTKLGSLEVPLVFDPYTDLLLVSPGAIVAPTIALLDVQGRATARLGLPAASPAGLQGLRLDHAFLVLEADGSGLSFASNPVPLRFVR